MRTRIASAGTGKTTTIIGTILTLILACTPLRRIAAVTYTRRAANDLKHKLRDALHTLQQGSPWYHISPEAQHASAIERAQRELDGAPIGTIHHLMRELLHLVAPKIGLDPDFSSLDEHDALQIWREEATTHAYLNDLPLERSTSEALDSLFGQRALALEFDAGQDESNEALLERYACVMERYRRRLAGRQLAPADLERAAATAATNALLLARWRERIAQVIVDEAQDLNPNQAEFFARLEAAQIPVSMVGDPKQSIYGFRHADIESFRSLIARAEADEPLTTSYRHARIPLRFLNKASAAMAQDGLGFAPTETPAITPFRDKNGSVTVHWVAGDSAIDNLRAHEADLLAATLHALHQQHHIPYRDMAILSRSRASQHHLQTACAHHHVPTTIVQGRNYYQQLEIRDLRHTLTLVHHTPKASLAAWLTSPYANLPTDHIHSTITNPAPLEHLRQHHPTIHARLEHIKALANHDTHEILTRLARDPLIDGRSYASLLTPAQADNVDTALVLLAPHARSTLEHLIQTLDDLAEQEHVGDVPQTGDGVRLTTIHASKGLEWPVVAVYDLGREAAYRSRPVIVQPGTGLIATKHSRHREVLLAEDKLRSEMEAYRLAYVAYSRAQDHLVITGSVKNGKPSRTIQTLPEGIRPGQPDITQPGLLVITHEYDDTERKHITPEFTPNELPKAPWSRQSFPFESEARVLRPSHASAHQPPDPHQSDSTHRNGHNQRAAITGTLVHHAIAQGWSSLDSATLRERLNGQAVLIPLNPTEREHILTDTLELLAKHHAMIGHELPSHEKLVASHRELPFVHKDDSGRVWSGTIDHLYRLRSSTWVLDDYKTDHTPKPDAHAAQLRLYGEAARAWMPADVTPTLRLVYLRTSRVIEIPIHETASAVT